LSAIFALPDKAPAAAAPRVFGRTIFDETWWLDAAAPGAWDRVEVKWEGKLVGEMNYYVQRGRAFTYLKMPPLTRAMSPRITPTDTRGASRFIQTDEIVRELYAKLPKHDRFERTLERDCPSVQGFTHLGLAVTHFFTLRSAPGECPEVMLQQKSRPKIRRLVHKAQRECETERSTDIERFISLHHLSYDDRNYVDHAAMRRIFEAAAAHGQAEIVFTKLNGQDAAALALVWDSHATYCWIGARNRALGDGGPYRLAFIEALRGAHARGTVLDVDGYASPEVGVVLMKLGFEPSARPYVNGSNRKWRAYWFARTLVKPRRSNSHYAVP
jgi:hypothetical protein